MLHYLIREFLSKDQNTTVGNDNSVLARSDCYKLDEHYEIAVSALSLEAVHETV